MLCEQCRMREASIVIREVMNGNVTEKHLCSQCASESDLGTLVDGNTSFARLLSGILGLQDARREEELSEADLACPVCGTTYKEFVRNSRFGCADCYNTFGILIYNNIKKLQGNDTHVGKKPRYTGDRKIHADMVASAKQKQGLKEKLEIYEAKQKEAVRDENYEQAAFYRDEIRKIRERMKADHEVV